jgi:hypothetical protein
MWRRCLQEASSTSPPPWQAFMEGVVYADADDWWPDEGL